MSLPTIEGAPDSEQTRPRRVVSLDLSGPALELLHRVVAPCSACGSEPLTPAHRLRARENVVCAERVADVLLMLRLIAELRRPVRAWAAPPRPAAA